MILRPATKEDEKIVYRWRNDPDVRRVSINKRKISAKEHSIWFSKALRDAKIMQFIDNGP